MNDADDIGFTFDPLPFLNGLKAVSSGIEKLGDRTVAATKSMGKSFQGALLKVEAIKIALRAGIATIKHYMPEIGKTLEISKDIFFKNFLWPLRKAIAPFLQYLLTWVRDNRASFVKWGQVLANVFKVVVTIVKAFWTVLKSVWEAMKPIFGKSLSDAVNVILTKIAVMASYIGFALGEVVKWAAEMAPGLEPIAEAFGMIVKAVADFAGGAIIGFLETLKTGKFEEALGRMADSFKKLVAAIFGENGELDWANFGENFGAKFADALEGICNLLGLAFDGVTALVNATKDLFAASKRMDYWEEMKKQGKITNKDYWEYVEYDWNHRPSGELVDAWGMKTGHFDQQWTPGLKWDKEGKSHGMNDPLNQPVKIDTQGSWFPGQTDVYDNPIPPPWANKNPNVVPSMTAPVPGTTVKPASTPPLLVPTGTKPVLPLSIPGTHSTPPINLPNPFPAKTPIPQPVPALPIEGEKTKAGDSRRGKAESDGTPMAKAASIGVNVKINMGANATAKATAQATYDAVLNAMVAEGCS